ncbi:hypothetical protein CLV59_109240 [Chitinophaga dinghuensis]|uniref:Uncharacterized protein n=1 Tax=Chitinophaga dinghuensis TaxID=1539050 RepID=A0A327VPD1_9BACT|nr:hypothetical protein [Chitinophaga dinghuensis]RAJ75626.1 hypothetical protein CLV59_109240 [Chitinophaga dinghuensis]
MNVLDINRHGSDLSTVIRKDWQDFPSSFLRSVFLFFMDKADYLVVSANRHYGYDPVNIVLEQLESTRKYASYWDVTKWTEVTVVFKKEDALKREWSEMLELVW